MRRVSMPGDFMDRKKNVRPLCLAALGSLRATRMAQSAQCAPDVQIFWPLITHSSPSRCRPRAQTGQVGARPGLGEELTPHLVAAQGDAGRERRFCASVP